MKRLLGKLLQDANEQEQSLILHIYKRLEAIREMSRSDQVILNKLKEL